jgi:hypothetical protein
MIQLNINTDGAVHFANTLEKLHKSALPSAVRGALNKAAFEVKTHTLQESANKNFVKRQPNFFKANSRFESAKGFDISTMKATVGMVSTGLTNGTKNHAVKDLEEQEEGGSIDRKSFIPMLSARKGGSYGGMVRPNARLSAIKKIIDTKNVVAKNNREKFVIAASIAGKGGFVLYNKILYRINSNPVSSLKNHRALIDRTPLYSFEKGRKARVHGTNFMKEASLRTAKQIQFYFEEEAMRQIKKYK